jgi:hypothetical protein
MLNYEPAECNFHQMEKNITPLTVLLIVALLNEPQQHEMLPAHFLPFTVYGSFCNIWIILNNFAQNKESHN